MKSQTRAGFTLVELMVAMAMTLLIMVILAQAFVIALDTFVGLKAIGDMQTNLRTAKTILTDDLSQDHFEGNLRMTGVAAQRPRAGFFAILQGSPVGKTPFYVTEGVDATNFPSFRATNHVLYMTVKRKGNRPENFFSTAVPTTPTSGFFTKPSSYTMDAVVELPPATYADPGFFNSQWAEVVYFLVKTGSTEEPLNATSTLGIPLFSLMRAQFVMVTEGTALANTVPNSFLSTQPGFQGMSCNQGATFLTFFSPSHAASATTFRTIPDLTTLAATRAPNIATLVLPNVTSFHIQVMPLTPSGSASFVDLANVSSGGALYDTTLINTPGYTNNYGLKGIQISLRVFEYKTRQTRQTTIVQDL